MKKAKKLISVFLVLVMSAMCFCSCSPNNNDTPKGSYITVGERELSKEYIGYFFYVAKLNMIKEAGFVTGEGGNATDEDVASFWETTEIEGKSAVDVARDLASDNAVIQTVQYLQAIKEGIKLTSEEEKEVEAQISGATQSSGGKEAFNAQLSNMGCDADAYRQIITENKYVQKLYDKYDSDGKLSVSDEELSFYASLAPEGTSPEIIFDSAKKDKFNKMSGEWEKEYEIVISGKGMKEFVVN